MIGWLSVVLLHMWAQVLKALIFSVYLLFHCSRTFIGDDEIVPHEKYVNVRREIFRWSHVCSFNEDFFLSWIDRTFFDCNWTIRSACVLLAAINAASVFNRTFQFFVCITHCRPALETLACVTGLKKNQCYTCPKTVYEKGRDCMRIV
jgi:hypothetical protein